MTDLADLRNSANETARVARGNLWLLLVVGLFLGILLHGTDDMALLTRGEVDAPLMQVSVSIDLLFGLGPVLFVLLHLNLFVRLDRLYRVSRQLREGIEAEKERHEWAREAALLFPFDFLQLLFHRMGRGPVAPDRVADNAATPPRRRWGWPAGLGDWIRKEDEGDAMAFMVILVVVPVFAFPLLLLMAIQVRFLPYQSEALTLVHQACVTIDLLIQFVFAVRLDPIRRFAAMVVKGKWLERVGYGTWCLYALVLLVLCPVFVWLVAVVPDGRIERNRPLPEAMGMVTGLAFGDWWKDDGCSQSFWRPTFMKRYLQVEGKAVQAARRDGAIVAAYLARGEDPELAWRFVEELDLGGRSFRYARFDGSVFRQASFRGSDLRCAQFNGARLRGANLERAKAQGAAFRSADLADARLERGKFEGASFSRARLDGAKAAGAALAGAGFRDASLHGTEMSGATFRATDLRDAELYGADLTDATIHGSNAGRAGFHGARLAGADVAGTSFREAGFHGADMQGVQMELVDLAGSSWERPQGWTRIRQALEAGQGMRTGEAQGARGEPPGGPVAEEDDGAAAVGRLAERARCAWTDGRGPFADWSVPGRACREELEARRVEMACANGRRAEAEAVAGVLVPMESWLDVGAAVALLEAGPERCAAVGADIRRELCDWLIGWFRRQRFGDAVEGGDLWREEYAGRAASWDEVSERGLCDMP